MMKKQMGERAKTNAKIGPSRKEKIMQLQDRFEFQERTVMPKGARMPGLRMDEEKEKEAKRRIHNEIEKESYERGDKRGELERLYNNIVGEIDERYKYMNDMKRLGKNVDNVIMGEIKERINDMKTLQKLIEEHDAKAK